MITASLLFFQNVCYESNELEATNLFGFQWHIQLAL